VTLTLSIDGCRVIRLFHRFQRVLAKIAERDPTRHDTLSDLRPSQPAGVHAQTMLITRFWFTLNRFRRAKTS
jgi:hypothetical protein